ncbi:metal-dependent hydrolase [Capsulimonas corticalis]|uniref:Metal-dependent hydrolase n=1 Tax=Capsulimonas corticalis TaxID=2219043 RepID=A0A402D3F7_9BACT|nr:serine hydrolase domain-containing protein [Capsulimonas corticalis]BDI28564.1 metal-dependent hydrolase [Capsulimonas corticalis]
MSTPPISRSQIDLADQILQRAYADGLFTHAAYALSVRGATAARRAFGAATMETVFDLASLTKPVATATGAMQLVEQGRLHLLQPVRKFFEEEFGALPHLTDVEVHHLLTHTSGLPPIPKWPKDGADSERKAWLQAVLSTPLLRAPGVGYTYSDAGYILLGEILRRVSGMDQAALFRQGVTERLSLPNIGYLPDASLRPRIAPTSKDAAGTVHDPRSRDMGGVSGHAGLFGTTDDLIQYAEAIRGGGPPLLSRAATARMAVSQIPRTVGSQSYGWFCAGNDFLPKGDLFSDRSFGHSGFTGTLLLIDPEYEVSLVLLTNRVVNETEDGSRFLRVRRYLLNAMAAALV